MILSPEWIGQFLGRKTVNWAHSKQQGSGKDGTNYTIFTVTF